MISLHFRYSDTLRSLPVVGSSVSYPMFLHNRGHFEFLPVRKRSPSSIYPTSTNSVLSFSFTKFNLLSDVKPFVIRRTVLVCSIFDGSPLVLSVSITFDGGPPLGDRTYPRPGFLRNRSQFISNDHLM